ncbi:hypothetical protein DY023_15695 [Microbacterium bovistercoris]|uniref:Uncharacterized protein n=1 Tax=Microbacterium bovistercoris TaxID=2293570 RepID=A0A371NQ95_9MICO|nr:hypothetical protein [Microbacterium bovistercoris]REJ04342.1 hypothetical protein DY023_15695 [Microbacterium bovistercoris]
MTLGLPQLPTSVPAYRVPWRILRDERAHPVVLNVGDEPVDFVRVFRDDPSTGIVTDLWGQVLPAERLELCLCSADLDDVVVTLAWFRPEDGLEYVWRFVV